MGRGDRLFVQLKTKIIDSSGLMEFQPVSEHWVGWQSSDINRPDIFQDVGVIHDFLRQHYLY